METMTATGTTGIGPETLFLPAVEFSEDVTADMIASVYEALEYMDVSTRREYEEALEYDPDLVHREMRIPEFLRTERLNPTRAAVRIALYWKYRKEFFGDRWLLPMNQAGTGTLSMEDIAILRSGYVVVLARPNQGPIVLVDFSRLPRGAGMSDRRNLFYLNHVFSDLRCQLDGITQVYIVTSARRPPVDVCPTGWGKIFACLPTVRVKKTIILEAHEEGREALIEQLAYQQNRTFQFKCGLPTTRVAGHSVGGNLSLMEGNGVQRHYLPRELGGDFDYSCFHDWVRQRLSLEDAISSVPIRRNHLSGVFHVLPAAQHGNGPTLPSTTHHQPTNVEHSDQSNIHESSLALANHPPKGTKDKRKVFGKPHYKKVILELEELRSKVADLERENKRVREQNRFLESKLGQARLTVALQQQTG